MSSGERAKGLPARRAKRARPSKPGNIGRNAHSHAQSFNIQPEGKSLTRMLETLKPHDHLCLIYESKEEWRAVVVPFISIGLKRGEKCIYIVDTSTAAEIRKYLVEEGVDVAAAEKSGQLSILHEPEAYTTEGSFDPDKMIALLISEIEKAIAEGYPAIRGSDETTWVLRGSRGSERLLEYEAKLDRDFFPKYPCLAICQYDRWKFDPEIIKGVVMTHPLLIKGRQVYHNFYYIPPEEFLNQKRAEMEAQHWLNNIEREQQIQETLRWNEEKYRTLTEQSLLGLIVIQDLRIVFANAVLAEISGFSVDELLSLPPEKVQALVHPEDQALVWGRLRYRLEGKMVPPRYECRGFRKDGTGNWLEMHASLIEYGGKPAVQCAIIDITERKRAEEALQQSEEKYRTILNELYEAYYELDLAGNYTFFNDALCRQTGYSKEELLGMNYRTYVPEEDCKSAYEKFNLVYRTGEPLRWAPFRNTTKDGRFYYTEDTVLPLRSESGEIIGFHGLSRDVTERRLAEEERKQLELKAQITSRLASVGEMAAGVAHEINNPLTGIIGYAQLLMEQKDIPPDIRSDLAAINDGAQRVAGIVQRLLAFSRQTKPQRKLVDINELIESTLILRTYHLRVNNIEVVTRLAPDLPETVADPGQIQQVLLNLIVNAETEMKLAHGKGKLTITTKKSDNTIKICVKDDGPGIKPELMDRIFDPFFTTREVGQGTGLGLSLCYGIVTEHKGKIYAESKPGKGATFIVELPVVTEAKLPKPAAPIVKKPMKANKARILVVDDEQVIRDVIKRVLTGEGHKVEAADNAADALKKIESQKYKLILVDIKMPGVNGVELYKRIQKISKSLARRVVFITGDIMGADTEKFLSEAKVAHIDKPFDAEQLSREVRRVLTGGR